MTGCTIEALPARNEVVERSKVTAGLPAVGAVPGFVLALAILGLWAPIVPLLLRAWRSDATASFGPLILLIAGRLAWEKWQEWRSCPATLVDVVPRTALPLIVLSSVVCIAAAWLDIVVLRAAALLLLSIGVAGYAGGSRIYRDAAGIGGFLAFAIPWPNALTSGLAFPLQMAGSSYAVQLAGMCGIPVVRHGVQLAVMGRGLPLYAVTVAAPCSGLTSTAVLLALGYLIALRTAAPLYKRAVLVLSVIPIALACNAVRLTTVLAAGAYISPAFGGWVHDHEAPILVSMCGLILVGIRWLIQWPRTEVVPGGNLASSTAVVPGGNLAPSMEPDHD